MFVWLKNALPRGLYSRAALILVVPVVTLQLAVTIAFLQRHFEDVTEQLTLGVVLEARTLADALETAPLEGRAAVAARYSDLLETGVILDAPTATTARRFYDISGRTVIATLETALPGFVAIDLATEPRHVTLTYRTGAGTVALRLDRERVSASNPHQLVVITIFVGGLMTLVAFVFLRNQLRPIKRLAAAAEAFGKGRTLPYRPAGALEVRAAGEAFLDMRARIERQIEQRTLLLSGVSHDLRTPLTRMRLELSLLDATPETRALERDIAEMEVLLEGFLDFSRGAATEAVVPTDPAALARDAVDKARRAGAEVQMRPLAQAIGEVPLRPGSVGRALDNLIGNAQRYAGRAEVSVRREGPSLVFRIEDDGPGIPPNRREEAMRPFARLDLARNQDKGSGAGLGLAIVADVARSHGGALRLSDSTRLGGLCAELILPV